MTLEINTSVASGWNPLVTVAVLCTVGAPMAKEHPPGGQGISHSPADGSNCSSEVTFLPSVVNTWQTGPFCPLVTFDSQDTGCASRGLHVWTTEGKSVMFLVALGKRARRRLEIWPESLVPEDVFRQ